MSTSVMQVRVDDDLRAKAAAVYDELGKIGRAHV